MGIVFHQFGVVDEENRPFSVQPLKHKLYSKTEVTFHVGCKPSTIVRSRSHGRVDITPARPLEIGAHCLNSTPVKDHGQRQSTQHPRQHWHRPYCTLCHIAFHLTQSSARPTTLRLGTTAVWKMSFETPPRMAVVGQLGGKGTVLVLSSTRHTPRISKMASSVHEVGKVHGIVGSGSP